MTTPRFLFYMGCLCLMAAVVCGCTALMTPDPVSGLTPLASAGIVLASETVQNPSVIGLFNGILGAAGIIGAAYLGRKKIAAGAAVVARVVKR
jgi:hypothetical protein